MPGVSAELAFRFLFALFPFLIFLAALSSYAAQWLGIQNPTQDILNEVGETLPNDAAGILESQLRGIFQNQNPGLLSVTAILALWSASSGTKTVMKALNRAYDVEEARPFLKKQAMGLLLTLVGGLAFLAAAIVLVVGQVVGQDIAANLGVGDQWATVVSWARLPVVLLLMVAATAFVYWSAPAASLPWRWFSWGAALFVVTWLIATLGFGFYVANFGAYENTYGSLGGVIILMTWLYITSFVLLLGAEFNVALERHAIGREAPEGMRQTDEGRAQGREAGTGGQSSQRTRRQPGVPEEVQVERRQPREVGRPAVGGLSRALGALVAGVVLVRLWR